MDFQRTYNVLRTVSIRHYKVENKCVGGIKSSFSFYWSVCHRVLFILHLNVPQPLHPTSSWDIEAPTSLHEPNFQFLKEI